MSATQLDQQGIDGSNLHAATTAGVPEFGGFDVVFAVQLEEGQCRQALHQLGSGLWSGKPLQKCL